MSRPLAIVDTNVVVSGLLTADPDAPTARILDAMLSGSMDFVVSIDLLAEYRRVLLRPKIVRRHGLSAEEIDTILGGLAETAIVRDAAPGADPARDRGDDHLWGLLATVEGAVLVTGDDRLMEAPPKGRSVVSPRSFAAVLAEPRVRPR